MKKPPTSFQQYCWDWIGKTFGSSPVALENATSVKERARRFVEEAIELAQSVGLEEKDIEVLTKYVYSRPVGQQFQEMGGTMVTLASLSEVLDIDMVEAGWEEIERCYQPEVMEKIQKKQVSKQLHGIGGSPL